MKSLKRLQLVLIVFAFLTLVGSILIGVLTKETETIGDILEQYTDHNHWAAGHVANSLEAGYIGGAIGLAIISASCIIGTVWLEIVKFKFSLEK